MTGNALRPPGRVLIIKPSALGDVATGVPVLRGLRRTFPDAHIAWLVNGNCSGLIAHDSDLDEVIIFERKRLGRAWRSRSAAAALVRLTKKLRAGRFDWVIDLQGLFRSGFLAWASGAKVRAGTAEARELAGWFYTDTADTAGQHTIDSNISLARQLGIDARPEDMTLQVSPAGQAFGEALRNEHALGEAGYLVAVPPTRWPTKLYPRRHWRRVITELAREIPVVVLGSQADRPMCEQIVADLDGRVLNLAGLTSVEQMVGVIAGARGVICSDSAAKFIAPAVGVDVVCLIGPTQAALTGPYGRGQAIVADLPCQGCQDRRCRHAICMELIGPGRVIDAARNMLSAEPDRCRTAT